MCIVLAWVKLQHQNSIVLFSNCFTHALASSQITQYQLYNWQLEPSIHVFLKTFLHSYKANNCTVALLIH